MEPQDSDLVIDRIFDAPLEKVWKAFSDPEMIKKWWGPKEFTCPVAKIDFREGGSYLFCMRDQKGKDFYSGGKYEQIIDGEKIVYSDSFMDKDGNVVSPKEYGFGEDFPQQLTVLVYFEEVDGKTKMQLRHQGMPENQKSDCTKGWNSSFDKLMDAVK